MTEPIVTVDLFDLIGIGVFVAILLGVFVWHLPGIIREWWRERR